MNSRHFWAEMANTYLKFGAHQDAIVAYTRALEAVSHPVEQADLWCKIGDIHLSRKNLPDAVSAYHAAAECDPQGHDFTAILDRIPQSRQYDQSVINAVKTMLGLPVAIQPEENEDVGAAQSESAPQPVTDLQPSAEPASHEAQPEPPLPELAAAAEDSLPEPATPGETFAIETAPEALPGQPEAIAPDETEPAHTLADHGLVDLPIEDILPDPQPLRAIISVEDLVESVRAHGIIQPLIVAPDEAMGKYVIIAGNRRLEAARQAGLASVPVIVRTASSRQRIEWSLVENTQRADLNMLERAAALRDLSMQFSLSAEDISLSISRPVAEVKRMLDLLRLGGAARTALLQHAITEAHASALLPIDLPEMQDSVLDFVIAHRLDAQQTHDLVRRLICLPEIIPAVVEAPVAEIPAVENAEEPPVVEAPVAEIPAVENAEELPVVEAPVAEIQAVENAEELPVVEAPVAEIAEEPPTLAEMVETDAGFTMMGSNFLPETEPAVHAAAPMSAPALQVAVETDVMTDVAVAAPRASLEQAWNAALDEMVIAPEPEPAPEPPVEIMPVHEENGVFDEARFKALQGISLYERVTADNPDNDRAWHTLGKYHSEVGHFDKAVECIQRAISIDASKDIYFFHLGQAYAATRRYLEAIRAFEQTVLLNPQHVFAHCSLAGYYRRLGNDSEAIKHIEVALPNIRQEKAYNQACFEAICGNTERAIELLKTSLRVDQVPLEWLRRDPDLDFIREDARFQQLLSDHESLLALKAAL